MIASLTNSLVLCYWVSKQQVLHDTGNVQQQVYYLRFWLVVEHYQSHAIIFKFLLFVKYGDTFHP